MNGEKLNLTLVSASSEYSASHLSTNALDGSTSSYWRTEDNPTYPQEIVVELDDFYKLCGFRIYQHASSSRTKSFKILASFDGLDFQEIYSNSCSQTDGFLEFDFLNALSSKYVKIEFTGNSTSKLYVYEFELYGELSEVVGTYYKIAESTLTSFGDQARRINGTKELLTPLQMLEIFKGAGQGGSSGGSNMVTSSVICSKIEPQKRTILSVIDMSDDYVTSSVTTD